MWSFVHRYYSHASKFNKALKYKGWETYVSKEVLKIVERGYAQVNKPEALHDLVRSRKKLKRFRELWSSYSKEIMVVPIADRVKKLPSILSRKKLEVEVYNGKAVVKGLCSKSLTLEL